MVQPSRFHAPPNNSGFYGNAGRDNLIGPGLATWDFSVMKETSDSRAIELAISSGNIQPLNHANFNTPNLIVAVLPPGSTVPQANPAAGAITSTSTTSRQVQFGLKLLW